MSDGSSPVTPSEQLEGSTQCLDAREESERLRTLATVVPAEYFDRLLAALDEPGELPYLVSVYSSGRVARRITTCVAAVADDLT
jgi:hypothetical protein